MNERADEHELAVDAPIAHGYRDAATQLNEVPSPAVRATVLAAAARAVQAKPMSVRADGGAVPLRGSSRYRVPLAAAASLLVGTVAVLLAQRTEDEMSPPLAMLPSAAPRTAAAPPIEPAPQPEQRAQHEMQREKSVVSPQVVASGVAESTASSTPEYSSRAAPIAAPAPVTAAAERLRETESAPLLVPSSARPVRGDAVNDVASPSPMTREEAAAVSGTLSKVQQLQEKVQEKARGKAEGKVEGKVQDAAQERVVARPVRRSAPIDSDAAPAASNVLAASEPDAATMADPQRWVERIAALRVLGRQDIADAELRALRSRYPDFSVPATVLRTP